MGRARWGRSRQGAPRGLCYQTRGPCRGRCDARGDLRPAPAEDTAASSGVGFSTVEEAAGPRGVADCLWGPSVTQSVFQLIEPGPCCVKFPPGLGGCIMNGEFNPYAADSFTLNSSAGGSPGSFDVRRDSQAFYEMFYALSLPLPTRPSALSV